MIGYAVYVISMDGRPIVSEKFQSAKTIPNETLLAGLLTAVQGVASEITKKADAEINSIMIDNLSYHFKSFGQYQIVLVTDLPESPENLLQKLGLSFMKDFGETLLEGSFDQEKFVPFITSINEIVKEELITDDTKMINPTKKFSSGELYQLPEELQPTALAMISLKEGNVEQIAEESGKDLIETERHLEKLQEIGLIGKKLGDHPLYFCSF
ncbi:MAG: hypothetical protein ACW98F_14730 [Candidatus Hodarchaeales archaeon]|jgi:hypothetical protein